MAIAAKAFAYFLLCFYFAFWIYNMVSNSIAASTAETSFVMTVPDLIKFNQ